LLMLAGVGEMNGFCTHQMATRGPGMIMGGGTTRLYPSENYNERKILIMRAGGFGDLVLLTPVLREIKRLWPTCILQVSTMPHYASVLAGLSYVDEVLPYPLPYDDAYGTGPKVYLENAIERNPRAKTLHMTELFAEIAGIPTPENLLPDYRVKASEAIWANERHAARRHPDWCQRQMPNCARFRDCPGHRQPVEPRMARLRPVRPTGEDERIRTEKPAQPDRRRPNVPPELRRGQQLRRLRWRRFGPSSRRRGSWRARRWPLRAFPVGVEDQALSHDVCPKRQGNGAAMPLLLARQCRPR
jgi:hypothetical protein